MGHIAIIERADLPVRPAIAARDRSGRHMSTAGKLLALSLLMLAFSSAALRAEEDPRARTDIDKALAEQLYRESEARQACKAKICEIARKSAQGDNVACKVLKTWPAIDLQEKILKGKLDWPWGNAQCEANLTLDRALIVAAMSQPKYEAKIGRHNVECRLSAKDGQDIRDRPSAQGASARLACAAQIVSPLLLRLNLSHRS
jgi:hypothetical protein